MINITHYISPRQTGKTKKAVDLFFDNDPDSTMIITINGQMGKNIQKRGVSKKNIKTTHDVYGSFHFPNITRFTTIVFDEYLINDLKNKNNRLLLELLSWYRPDSNLNVYLLSTPYKKFTQEEIDTNRSLFLSQPIDNSYNVNVIQTCYEYHQHGFKRVDMDRIRTFSSFCPEMMVDCEFLGLYRVGEKYNQHYIPKPKIFKVKH